MKQIERREFLKTTGLLALGRMSLSVAAAKGLAADTAESTHVTLRKHLTTVEDQLNNGIIPFWFQRALDTQYGGFMTNFDEQGKALPVPEKYVNTQCRLIWWFSTLRRRFPQLPKTTDMASQGVDFLIKNFWDEKYGGFYWKVKRDGSELDPAKIVYGESFCIYALSEYYLATGDKRGLEYASRTFDLLQKYAADTLNGGYIENVNRDWSPESGGFAGGDRKGLDTHMHLMESFTTLYAASGDDLHRRKLLQVVELIREKMIDKSTGCGLNQFDLAFHSLAAIPIKRTWNGERLGEKPADPVDTTSYGHNVELEYLMHLALKTAHGEADSDKPIYKRLLDHAAKHGVDWEFGGIFRDGLRATGEAIVLEKEFWQHSESLVAFVDGYELFREPRYLEAFGKIWQFVQDHMIIKGVGEWRTLLDRQGKPIDPNIGNPWKVSYHTGRSMLECRERLIRLLA
jgi:mannobiose 2-epimerase